MTKYLISFPGPAMDVPTEEMAAVSEAAHGVIREAKEAGVYVFGGGINEEVAPLMVAAEGTVTNETYTQTKEFDGRRQWHSRRRILCPGTPVSRRSHPMGCENRSSLPLLAGTPRIPV